MLNALKKIGSVFSAGIDLEEFGPTFRDMTATSGEGGKDAARKSVDIMRFVSGMQETFASLNRCVIAFRGNIAGHFQHYF